MRSTRATWVAGLALCAACTKGDKTFLLPPPAQVTAAPAPAVLPLPVARGSRVTSAAGYKLLPENIHPLARPEFDTGRMDPTVELTFSLLFSPAGTKAERDALTAALQNPRSPMYHKWLSPEDYAARFGVSADDMARVSAWLEEQGFEVGSTWRTGNILFFTGTVAQLEQAFQTEMHTYDVRGEKHFALAQAPSIPAAFGDLVTGLYGVHDFHPPAPMHTRAQPSVSLPEYKANGNYWLAPPDFAAIYDVNPLYQGGIDGTGQDIGVIGGAELITTDYSTFRTLFGFSATMPNVTLVPGTGNPGTGQSGYQDEAMLDVEWTGAVAKNATVQYVYVGDSPNYSVDTAVLYAISTHVAPVISFSFGGCEIYYSPAETAYNDTMASAAVMMGMTFVVASGDAGPAACDAGEKTAANGLWVSYPASMPEALAVGGTDVIPQPANMYFDDAGTAISYIPEQVWDETTVSEKNGQGISAGGGGMSQVFSKPAWQYGVTPGDGQRDVPDVALSSGAYVMPHVCVIGGSIEAIGGTSASAPSFAGVLTLLNQAIGAAQPGLGNANPVLYALYGQVPSAFHDITAGTNCVPCQSGTSGCPSSDCPAGQFGYAAKAGYDLATGMGSIDVANLVDAWKGLTPTSTQVMASATGMTEGSPLTLTVTIGSNNTGSTKMTGAVDFYYATQLPDDGGLDVAALMPNGEQSIQTTTSGGDQGATVTFDTYAPPGFTGSSTIVAFYEGDQNYLASWSQPVTVTATPTLTISPTTATVAPNGTVQFTCSGADAGISCSWNFFADNSGASIGITTGQYTAGTMAGTQDVVVALDSYGAQAIATVNVVAATSDGGTVTDSGGPTSDSSAPMDGGQPATDGSPPVMDAASGEDTGTGEGGSDGGAGDGGTSGGGTSGCACGIAGGGSATNVAGASMALLGFLAFGMRRRRRS